MEVRSDDASLVLTRNIATVNPELHFFQENGKIIFSVLYHLWLLFFFVSEVYLGS